MRVLRVVGVLLFTAALGLAGSGPASAAPAAPAAAAPALAAAPAVSAPALAAPALAAPAVAAAPAAGTPCAVTSGACVDLSAHRAWLIRNGAVVYGPVSALGGKRSARTPVGTFHVTWKDIDHLSHQFHNAPMPYSVFFTTTGVAFHQGSLRTPSAGCVHLSRTSAQKFFSSLQVGDVVQVVP